MEIFKVISKNISVIFKNNKKFDWSKTHAWVPTPVDLYNDNIKVLYGSRNKKNLTQTGYFVYNLKKRKIIFNSKKPILKLGNTGEFDDSLSLVTSCLRLKSQLYLYFVGWIIPKNTRFFPSVGVAKSNLSFSKVKKHKKPIMDRNVKESLGFASPFILSKKKQFFMWYVAIRKWIKNKSDLIPIYNLSYGVSKDGINWKYKKKEILKTKKNETISRPWIIFHKKKYHMWYSYRELGKKFKIGYATSSDGIKWHRRDKELKIPIKKGFNDQMSEYPAFFNHKNKFFLLFNGNDYGKTGVGLVEMNYGKK
tara:strand:+ start:14387 stop:15310 length:924 start_codon:yes stop_codon:yes gene_type:complete